MDYPLLVHQFLERANTFFPNKEIVTREGEDVHRYTYSDLMPRASRLSSALAGLGVGTGDRVGTFAWNPYRHLEVYFAAPAMGAVLHTINIRLFTEDLVHIINHAGDKVILVDPDLVPILEPLASQFESVEHFIIMTDDRSFTTTLPSAHNYEDLLSGVSDEYSPVRVDENAPAGLCYTSATTGRPAQRALAEAPSMTQAMRTWVLAALRTAISARSPSPASAKARMPFSAQSRNKASH